MPSTRRRPPSPGRARAERFPSAPADSLHSGAFAARGSNITPTAPPTVPNEFVAPNGGKKGETVDTAAALWTAASDDCWSRGGHVPTAAELALLIQQGLPDGTNAYLWTSDQSTFNGGSQFLLQEMRWTGTPSALLYTTTDVNWVSKSGSRAYRCIYYPVDSAYAGPSSSDCAGGGGCTMYALPSGGGKLWIDTFDRAPSAVFPAAVDACRQVGGHLASERDYIEAIRQSLPNGTNAWNYTSNVGLGSSTVGVRANLVRWTGVDPAFTDLYSTYMSWSTITTARAYRCSWTNQLY